MNAMTPPKLVHQLQLEDEMRGLGIDRYRKDLLKARGEGSESRTLPARRIIVEAHAKVAQAIREFMVVAASGRPGKRHVAVALFHQINDPDLMALLALRQVLDSIMDRETLNGSAIHLATLIEDELHYRAFEEQIPSAFNATRKKLKIRKNETYKRKSATQTARKLGVVRPSAGWSKRDKLMMGVKLIELVVTVTGLVQIKHKKEGAMNTPVILEATEATREWINGENSRLEWLAPIYMPCVIEPVKWTTPFKGGYHSGKVRKLTLVKTRSAAYLDELQHNEMPEVYDGINALQSTAWAINNRVLDVMRALWEGHQGHGIVPEGDPIPLPNKPLWLVPGLKSADMTAPQLAEFKTWKDTMAQVHEANARAVCRRLSFSRMLWVAEKFKDEEEMFFPHQLDFRGRAYPVTLYLHPQGDSAQRGLLQFANEAPIHDEAGALWLAVHGAGCWGVDKLSLEARQEWVFKNERDILAVETDPLVHRFWMDAEKPWEALAFCFDWAGFKREGFGYNSCLPIQMDGTCNGLQNFSAILRDEIGGAAVNLVPALTPQDIYLKVAEVVAERVMEDAEACDGQRQQIAKGWLGHIDRKVCKRPVMTLAYGARAYGFKQMVFEDTITPWLTDKPDTFPFEGNGWFAAEYLGGLIYECVGSVVIAAKSAMDWLQEAARMAAKEGHPVHWRTPTGLVIQQAYRLPNVKRIELMFEQARLRLTLTDDASKIDSRKQASGISPNWVHSLDASHMMKTLNACHALGIRSFCFIHDSYGTHAGNAGVLAQVLREEFVRMYSERDVMADFARDLRSLLPTDKELPPLPQHGSLDLSQVLESAFFFA